MSNAEVVTWELLVQNDLPPATRRRVTQFDVLYRRVVVGLVKAGVLEEDAAPDGAAAAPERARFLTPALVNEGVHQVLVLERKSGDAGVES